MYVMFAAGVYDWDLSLKAKSDGSLGLEGLKYDPKEGGGAASGGASPRDAAAGDDVAEKMVGVIHTYYNWGLSNVTWLLACVCVCEGVGGG